MSERESVAVRRFEFESHMWNHASDDFQAAFDERAPLTEAQINSLVSTLRVVWLGGSPSEVGTAIRKHLYQSPHHVLIILQLVGLTRNKILQDLKGHFASTGVKVPSRPEALHTNDEVWEAAGPYLGHRLNKVFRSLGDLPTESIGDVLEALNQATWPGWIRQERAKRQGHEAEYRLAVMLSSLGIPFEPREKADNPLCQDAQIDSISYDLVVPDLEAPGLCVKSTVHTANIGQYGESKDALEVTEAVASLSIRTPSPILLAMIDGVGFRSNRAGLETVLQEADEFCQFRTIWKAAVAAASVTDQCLELVLPDPDAHKSFLARYAESCQLAKQLDDRHWICAGEAFIRLSP